MWLTSMHSGLISKRKDLIRISLETPRGESGTSTCTIPIVTSFPLLGRYRMGIDPRSTLTVDPHQASQHRAIADPREEVDHVARSAQRLSRQPKYKIRDHLTLGCVHSARDRRAYSHSRQRVGQDGDREAGWFVGYGRCSRLFTG